MSEYALNFPTPAGRALGDQVARLTKPSSEMCASCAFRAGTYPNGCAETVFNAARCVIEGTPFYCHVKKERDGTEAICAGYLSAVKNPDWGENLAL